MNDSLLAAAALAGLSATAIVAAVAAGPNAPVSIEATSVPSRRRRLAVLACGARPSARARISSLLEAARADRTADEVIGLGRLGAAVAVAASVLIPRVGPLLAVPLAAAALRGPEIALARRARRRMRASERELPLFLDLLSIAATAGIAPQLAVRLAAGPVEGPLREELHRALEAADLGRRWRDELAAAAERTRVPDLQRAVRLLTRSEQLGSSLADEMVRLATEVRTARRSRAAERARSAPVKMLFPLVFLILPAFLLLTVVPVLLATVRSIG